MRAILIAVFASAVATAAYGCGDDSPPTPSDMTLEVGTGESAFEPVGDMQEVPLVFGPQGGHHVWISFRVTGFQQERVLMDLDVVPLGELEPPPDALPVRLLMTPTGEEGSYEYVGWPAQLYDAGCYVGVPTSFRMTLTDPAGNQVSDEIVVVPADGAPGLEPCSSGP